MVSCPQCKATLPPGSLNCQFCGASWGEPGGSGRTGPSGRPGAYGRKRGRGWVWTAYYLVAGWWILNGLISVAQSVMGNAGGSTLGALFGAVTALIGLGLILNVDLARGIVNVIAFLRILFGLFGLVMLFFVAPVMGIWGPIALILTFLDIGLAGFMIFLIGETETRGPNF